MKIGKIISLYARSKLGIGTAAVCALGAAAAALAGLPVPFAAAAAVLGYGGLSAALIGSGHGVKNIVEEKDRDRAADITARIEEASSIRARISRLRIPDSGVSDAVGRFLYASGAYLEACRKHGAWAPEANAGIAVVLEVLGDYLSELDEQAAEKHFGGRTGTPLPDVRERALSAIEDAGRTIKEKTLEIEGGLDAKDRFSIREDLT
jgi:hypothetical protein